MIPWWGWLIISLAAFGSLWFMVIAGIVVAGAKAELRKQREVKAWQSDIHAQLLGRRDAERGVDRFPRHL